MAVFVKKDTINLRFQIGILFVFLLLFSFSFNAQTEINSEGFDSSLEVYNIGAKQAEIINNSPLNTSNSVLNSDVSVDFDGTDDYIETDLNLSASEEITLMAWVKLDTPLVDQVIMGQDIAKFYITSEGNLGAEISLEKNKTAWIESNDSPIVSEVWTHVTMMYNSNNKEFYIYINGQLWTNITESSKGKGQKKDPLKSSTGSIEIGRDSNSSAQYFAGAMVEVKVFKRGLTEEEIQHQVYQQIEENNGAIDGVKVPKSIGNLLWNNLELYLKLEPSSSGKINASDFSNKSRNITLYGMTTIQDTNAPLPFLASSSGGWSTEETWEYGDVWNVENLQETQPWAIVELTDAVDLNSGNVNISLFGFIIPETSSFTMDGTTDMSSGTGTGHSLTVSDYLKLNGVLDLEGESQLFQGADADNLIGTNGYLERDQQGTLDTFTYNYWSSPVSENGDNYCLSNVIANVKWVGGLDGSISPLSIAEYWIWTFANGTAGDYSKWRHTKSTGTIYLGEGFTMKGPGAGVDKFQNYSFRGVPNNGDISLPISSGSNYLVGNPYPSALDADQFILDNRSVLEDDVDGSGGTLLFWEHWGGGSHYLKDYQGGYAYYSIGGGTPAVSAPQVSQNGSGTKTPGQYIPVGQGFFVSTAIGIPANSKIQFNNNQRVFITESNPNNSLFMKSEVTSASSKTASSDTRMKIRLGVDMPKGYHRQLLVAVDQRATHKIDYGFDARLADDLQNDMFWVLNDEKFIIQGVPTINRNTEISLGFSMNSAGTMKIGIDDLQNVPENLPLYIKDLETGDTFELSENGKFEVELEAGLHLDKYALVFHPKLVSEKEVLLKDGMSAYLSNKSSRIHISKIMDTEISQVQLFNISGQLIKTWTEYLNANELILPANLNTGVYLLRVETSMGVFSKKLLKS